MTEIYSKKSEVFIKIAAEVVFLIVIIYLIYLLVSGAGNISTHQRNNYFAYMALALIGCFIFFLQTLLIPHGVILNDEDKSMVIKYLILPNKTIYRADIHHYNEIAIKKRGGADFGILIFKNNNKQVLLSEEVLESYVEVQIFLDAMKVENKGEIPFNLISYCFNQ